MTRVKLDVLKPWINQRVANYLNGLEDDVVVEFVFNQVSKLKKKKNFFLSGPFTLSALHLSNFFTHKN